ncbi:MAG: glycosyltransferase family 2 protein [Mesorhizobium sp.]|nr:glycosyltransferase family 2 protein [Mesorhizobium sp.]MCO5159996.1 glycosyltransferase family 2 protein [Mesorhizobium sp.]
MPRVAILACVYNGERFLAEQFASLERQTVPDIDLWISDDGSTDASLDLLATIGAGWRKGAFTLLRGSGKGFAENFRSLMVNDDIAADYYAFCDQDDIWAPDKLEAAIAWLAQQPADRPALYGGRTRTVDIAGRPVGFSPLFAEPPSFRNAIVQSIAGGNTMVMNRAARELMAEASRRSGFVSHDWWCYMMVTGAGGAFRYSPEPRVDYRQHVGNLVGSNDGVRARLGRSGFLLGGGFARWTDRNLAGLQACRDLLSEDAREVLDRFVALRKMWLPWRLFELWRSGIHRQTRKGQASLYIASAINRL